MAVSIADLLIRVSTDTSRAKKPLDDTASRVDKVGSRMGKLALPAAAVVGGIAAFGKSAVEAASKAQQAFGAIDSVFGRNAGVVKKWAASAATDVGLSRAQYGEFATVIGSQLKNLGLPMDQVVGKTKDMIAMGADLAATYGGTTADAVSALSATMRGETDPIERYGVSIKQATIDAEMAAEGTDKLTGAAAKQARTQATLKLITEQTAAAHGQFARESDSAAGSAQIATAQYENMKATLGTALLPVVAMVGAALGRFSAFAEKNATVVQILAGVLLGLALAVLAVNAALKVYQATLVVVNAVQKATWLSNPIFLVIAAVILLVAAVVILWKRSETFRRVVTAVWKGIKAGAVAVANVVKSVWRVVWSVLSAYVRGYLLAFRVAFAVIRAVSSAIAGVLKSVWRAVWSAIGGYVRSFVSTVRSVLSGIKGISSSVTSSIKSAWSNVWSALKSAAKGVGEAVSAPFRTIESAIDNVISAVQSLIGWLGKIHVPKISLPKIPGLSSLSATAGISARSAFAPTVAGPRATGLTAGAPTELHFHINGLVADPEGTARAIRRLLTDHDRRTGVSAA